MSEKDKPENPKKRGKLENLKPWPKGVSGNPSGRPKKRPITDEYANLADQPLPEKLRKRIQSKYGITLPAGVTWAQTSAIRRFLEAIGEKVESGGTRAAKEIRESIEGKAPQRIEITTPPKTEIRIRVRFDRSKKPKQE